MNDKGIFNADMMAFAEQLLERQDEADKRFEAMLSIDSDFVISQG
jgi:hypothetical protein